MSTQEIFNFYKDLLLNDGIPINKSSELILFNSVKTFMEVTDNKYVYINAYLTDFEQISYLVMRGLLHTIEGTPNIKEDGIVKSPKHISYCSKCGKELEYHWVKPNRRLYKSKCCNANIIVK